MSAAAVIRCPKDQSEDVTLVSTEGGKGTRRKVYRCNVCHNDFVVWEEKSEGMIQKAQKR